MPDPELDFAIDARFEVECSIGFELNPPLFDLDSGQGLEAEVDSDSRAELDFDFAQEYRLAHS